MKLNERILDKLEESGTITGEKRGRHNIINNSPPSEEKENMYDHTGFHQNGDVWRADLYRIDLTPEPEFSCWSPTLLVLPNFHVPKAFGKNFFVKDF